MFAVKLMRKYTEKKIQKNSQKIFKNFVYLINTFKSV